MPKKLIAALMFAILTAGCFGGEETDAFVGKTFGNCANIVSMEFAEDGSFITTYDDGNVIEGESYRLEHPRRAEIIFDDLDKVLAHVEIDEDDQFTFITGVEIVEHVMPCEEL